MVTLLSLSSVQLLPKMKYFPLWLTVAWLPLAACADEEHVPPRKVLYPTMDEARKAARLSNGLIMGEVVCFLIISRICFDDGS